MKLLHIAASPKLDEQSVGKRVANAFVDAYFNKHEQVQYRYIDLHTLEIPAMTKELLEAFESGKAQREKEEQALKIYDSLCNEFITADRYVISFPNWNLTAPPVLVSYMLAVIRAGKAFRYTEQGSEGLLHNKKICFWFAEFAMYKYCIVRGLSKRRVKQKKSSQQQYKMQDSKVLFGMQRQGNKL